MALEADESKAVGVSPAVPKCFKFTVAGRVQGVGFRYFVLTLATRLNISGEVWNSRTGEVEGLAFAFDAPSLDEFRRDLTLGPGRVQALQWIPVTADKAPSEFSISHTR